MERLKAVIATHDILRVKGFVHVPGKDMRLIVQGVGEAGYNEIAEIVDARGNVRLGVVLETAEDMAVVEVFERMETEPSHNERQEHQCCDGTSRRTVQRGLHSLQRCRTPARRA